jgi:hypothetical protein
MDRGRRQRLGYLTRPCDNTVSPLAADSTLPVASCSGYALGAVASALFNRASTPPPKLASESIRNWPNATTFCLSSSRERITISPPTSGPIRTSIGSNRLPSAVTMTRLRVVKRTSSRPQHSTRRLRQSDRPSRAQGHIGCATQPFVVNRSWCALRSIERLWVCGPGP